MPKERVERDEEDLVRLYLTDIGQYPLLTKDDEVRLAQAIEAGNTAPKVQILAPSNGVTVPNGSTVSLRGVATDAEQGPLPCTRLSWDVRLGHNSHSHPIATLTGCEVSFQASLDSDHAAVGNLFFAVELTARDDGTADGAPPLVGRDAIRINVQR